jgi:uncharacterized protein (DUF433 family)
VDLKGGWFRRGATGFGGPTALAGFMQRDLVEKRRWISREDYVDGLALVSVGRIRLDEEGVAWIDGTQVKIIELAIDKLAHGSSPEEMHFQYPHLSVAQIHAALAYYYDHQGELDSEIERRLKYADDLAARNRESTLRKKLLKLSERR